MDRSHVEYFDVFISHNPKNLSLTETLHIESDAY